jgi:8-oxo-dGTP diphosphatase
MDPEEAEVKAAGGVVVRDGAIAVVHRPRYDDWSLPKGKLDPGETFEECALREVWEETGMRCTLGDELSSTSYRDRKGRSKVVRYWRMTAGDGQFVPSEEVDELRWLPLDAAGELLSYRRDVDVLDRFRRLSPPPRPLLLVRHAKAGSRHDWSGDDDLRPLSGKGRRQADELARMLRLFGPTRAYAAPPIRCPDTIGRLDLSITTEPLLGERGYLRDPSAGLARLLEIAAGEGVPVVCSQGGVIPDLVHTLTGRPDPPSRKGSTWVLGFASSQVTTADYYPDSAL